MAKMYHLNIISRKEEKREWKCGAAAPGPTEKWNNDEVSITKSRKISEKAARKSLYNNKLNVNEASKKEKYDNGRKFFYDVTEAKEK